MKGLAGFTLVEAVLALAILSTVCGGVLMALAAGRAVALRGRHETVALTMAQARLAELRASTFTTAPATSPALAETPEDALWRDRDGCVDYLDAAGRPIAGRAAAAYVRRWRIGRRGSGAAELATVSVLVAPMAEASRAAARDGGRSLEPQPGVVVLRSAVARGPS